MPFIYEYDEADAPDRQHERSRRITAKALLVLGGGALAAGLAFIGSGAITNHDINQRVDKLSTWAWDDPVIGDQISELSKSSAVRASDLARLAGMEEQSLIDEGRDPAYSDSIAELNALTKAADQREDLFMSGWGYIAAGGPALLAGIETGRRRS